MDNQKLTPEEMEIELDKLNYIIYNLSNSKSQMEINYLVKSHENERLQRQIEMLTAELMEHKKGGDGE